MRSGPVVEVVPLTSAPPEGHPAASRTEYLGGCSSIDAVDVQYAAQCEKHASQILLFFFRRMQELHGADPIEGTSERTNEEAGAKELKSGTKAKDIS
jgi:hypothetical protein